MSGSGTGRSYLDHASASPLRPAAAEAVVRWLSAADPGRIHHEGQAARVALEEARAAVAALFSTRPRQVIFTSGGTEAINAATFGAVARANAGGPGDQPPRIVLPVVEHAAVRLASAQWVGEEQLVWIPVDRTGLVDLDALLEAVDSEPAPALVHCQWANHEVGTIQPVAEVVAACRARHVLVHVDAASAAGHVPIDFDALGADLLSVSAAKLGGPRGAGALLVRRGLRVPPLLVGGDQERARRAGLEDVPAVMGFGAAAAELAGPELAGGELAGPELAGGELAGPDLAGGGVGQGGLEAEAARAAAQTDRLRDAAVGWPGVEVLGPPSAAGRVPHLVCLGLEGVEAEAVLLGLDQAGVAAHSGSACSSEALEPSPVLAAMGVDAARSLRLSVGWSTTDDDIGRVVETLPAVLGRLRALARG